MKEDIVRYSLLIKNINFSDSFTFRRFGSDSNSFEKFSTSDQIEGIDTRDDVLDLLGTW